MSAVPLYGRLFYLEANNLQTLTEKAVYRWESAYNGKVTASHSHTFSLSHSLESRFTQSWRSDIVGSEFAVLSSLQVYHKSYSIP